MAPQDKNQLGGTHSHDRTLESPIHMRDIVGRVPSSRIYACRAKTLQTWRLDQTLHGSVKINKDTNPSVYSPQPRMANIKIKKSMESASNRFFTRPTLRQPHRDHLGPRSTWWHPLSRSSKAKTSSMHVKKKTTTLVVRVQNFRGSLRHVRDDSGARPTHSSAVPH